MKTQGRRLMQSGSVLLVIFGALLLYINISGIQGYRNMDGQMLSDMAAISNMDVDATIQRMTVQAIVSGTELLIGIVGFVMAGKSIGQKAGLCLAVVTLVLIMGSVIYAAVTTGTGFETIIGTVLGIIGAVLMLAGGFKSRKENVGQ